MALAGQQVSRSTYPPVMEGARVEAYKTIGGVTLNLYVFDPPRRTAGQTHPAIVFFFGGGWRNGSPQQFEPHCRYFASRGMVAIAADYRVSSRNGTKADDSVRDAKSAIRWVRQNAARLGIDPSRIVAAGGSAGGHIAAVSGIIPGLDEPGEDTGVSSRPNALVLFNPVLVVAPAPGTEVAVFRNDELEGIDRAAISPFQHLGKGEPPAIILHGKADTTVPYATAELYAKQATAFGNRCDLIGYEGETHGFFNYGLKDNKPYNDTVKKADEFLVSLGYLPAKDASR